MVDSSQFFLQEFYEGIGGLHQAPMPPLTPHEKLSSFLYESLVHTQSGVLINSSVHSRHLWLKHFLNELALSKDSRSKPAHIQFLSMNSCAKTSFGTFGDSLYRYLDLSFFQKQQQKSAKPPPLEYLVTVALHQHKTMQKINRNPAKPNFSSSGPASGRYDSLKDPRSIAKRYATSCLARLSALKTLVILDFSAWPIGWFDHLDLLCRLAHDFNVPFGGLQVLLEGDFFRPGPMDKDSPYLLVHASSFRHYLLKRVYAVESLDACPTGTDAFLKTLVRDASVASAAFKRDLVIPIETLCDALSLQRHTGAPPDVDTCPHIIHVSMSKQEAFERNQAQLDRCIFGPWSSLLLPVWHQKHSFSFEQRHKTVTHGIRFMADGSFVGVKPATKEVGLQMGLPDVAFEEHAVWYPFLHDWLLATYSLSVGQHSCFFGKQNMMIRLYTDTQKTPKGEAIPWGAQAKVVFIKNSKEVVVRMTLPHLDIHVQKDEGKRDKANGTEEKDEEEDEEEIELEFMIKRETVHLRHADFAVIEADVFPFVAHYATNLYEWQGSSALPPNTLLELTCSKRMPSYPGVIYAILQLVRDCNRISLQPPIDYKSVASSYSFKRSSHNKDPSKRQKRELTEKEQDEETGKRVVFPQLYCELYGEFMRLDWFKQSLALASESKKLWLLRKQKMGFLEPPKKPKGQKKENDKTDPVDATQEFDMDSFCSKAFSF